VYTPTPPSQINLADVCGETIAPTGEIAEMGSKGGSDILAGIDLQTLSVSKELVQQTRFILKKWAGVDHGDSSVAMTMDGAMAEQIELQIAAWLRDDEFPDYVAMVAGVRDRGRLFFQL